MAKAAQVGEANMDPPPVRLKSTCEIHSTLPSEISKNQEVMIGEKRREEEFMASGGVIQGFVESA
jgi:hypothetical protein